MTTKTFIKKDYRVIILIILFTFILRLWGINFGLPHKNILDEEALVYRVFYTGSNSLAPLRYIYAPLVPYLILVEYGIFFMLGKLSGIFNNTNDFFISYLKDPTVFFLIARVTMAMFGTATVWLTWLIGKKFFGKAVGVIAAFFLALTFLHVKESHYIKEDIIAGFFVLAAFYFSLKIVKYKNLKNYIWAGITLGLALGAKYQSVLILPVVLLAIFLKSKRLELRKLGLFFSVVFLAYTLTNPYLVIEPNNTIQGIVRESALGRISYPLHLQGKPVWWWFTTEHIPQGLGWPLYLAGAIGFIASLRIWFKDKKKLRYLLISIFPITFLVSLDFWTKFHFARYAVPLLPFFALGAAILLVGLAGFIGKVRLRKVFLTVSSVLVIIPSFLRVVKFNRLITAPDTREMGLNWIKQNVVENSKVLVESTVRPEYPSNLATPLPLSEDAIRQRISDAEERGEEGLYLKSLLTAMGDKLGYDIVATPRVDMKTDIFDSSKEILEDASYYADEDVEYLILSSWAIRPDIKQEFLASIGDYYDKVVEFKPTYEFPDDPHFIRVDYSVLDKVDPFRKELVFGPEIDIYKKR